VFVRNGARQLAHQYTPATIKAESRARESKHSDRVKRPSRRLQRENAMGLAELQVLQQVRPVLLKKKPAVQPGPFLPRTLSTDRRQEAQDVQQFTLLTVAEMGWAMLLVTPLVVGQWRGCWELMVHYTPEAVSPERFCFFPTEVAHLS
jgi:hypothetical protein